MMPKKNDPVYQFKITLKGSKPLIWRRIQVPESCNFFDLNVAIQNAMGWDNSHEHAFEMKGKNKKDPSIHIIMDDGDDFWDDTFNESIEKIADHFLDIKTEAIYEYDFVDSWRHSVVLEKIIPRETGVLVVGKSQS